jgi:hypothetical protein
MILGVSFLATPAKFMASSITLPVALDAGRHAFSVLNKIECGLGNIMLWLACSRWRSNAKGYFEIRRA